MTRVLDTLTHGRAIKAATSTAPNRSPSSVRASSDEFWIIDICDGVLGKKASRQHRFPFLQAIRDPLIDGHYFPSMHIITTFAS